MSPVFLSVQLIQVDHVHLSLHLDPVDLGIHVYLLDQGDQVHLVNLVHHARLFGLVVQQDPVVLQVLVVLVHPFRRQDLCKNVLVYIIFMELSIASHY